MRVLERVTEKLRERESKGSARESKREAKGEDKGTLESNRYKEDRGITITFQGVANALN